MPAASRDIPNLVLPFLGADERGRIDVLQPDEDRVAAGVHRLVDEAGNAMAQRIDLQNEGDLQLFALPQRGQAVENGLPIAVPSKLSSVIRKRVMPCAALARTIVSTSSAVR
jgi:hypothetical protein